jgi:sialate O-acetylesterase
MGLISSNWGGTKAEVWIARDSVMKKPHLVQAIKNNQSIVGMNYNAMIAPIVNYNIAGVLWYQGESNVGQYRTYTELMNDLILSWRSAFNKNFPFYFAQIAPYNKYGDNINGAKLREAQTNNLALENTAMVVLSDLVPDVSIIHPTIKIEVANRFANLALVKHYGQEAGPIFYPKYDRLKIENGKIKIYVREITSKLVSKDGDPSHLMIAGEDRKFYPAEGKISGSVLTVSSPEVPKPVAVRYAFKNDDMPNLFSKEGLPVNLFRTDTWED